MTQQSGGESTADAQETLRVPKNQRSWDPVQWIWRFFSSVKLAVVLISSLTLVSAVGSFIQQYDQAQQPLEEIYSPEVLEFLRATNLIDLYHSTLFVLLVALLAINLTVCSFDRLPGIWRAAKRIPGPFRWDQLKNPKAKYLKSYRHKEDHEQLLERVKSWVQSMRHEPHVIEKKEDGTWQLFFHRQLFSKKAVWVIHTSLLVIMAGGVWGALDGFEGVMTIPEGDKVSYFRKDKGDPDQFPEYYEFGKRVPNYRVLPFSLKLEKFDLQFWESHPERPKGFKSTLSVWEDGQRVHTQTIDVNQPLVWGGVSIYQASYGEAGAGQFTLWLLDKEEKERRVLQQIRPGEVLAVTDNYKGKPVNLQLEIVDFEKNFQPAGQPLGEAVKLQVTGDPATKEETESFWVMKNHPRFDLQSRDANFYFIFRDRKPEWFTGLQVSRDPGAYLVWVGCFFLLIAVMAALFTSHQKFWVGFDGKRVVLKGQSNKPILDFDQKFEKMYSKMVAVVSQKGESK